MATSLSSALASAVAATSPEVSRTGGCMAVWLDGCVVAGGPSNVSLEVSTALSRVRRASRTSSELERKEGSTWPVRVLAVELDVEASEISRVDASRGRATALADDRSCVALPAVNEEASRTTSRE